MEACSIRWLLLYGIMLFLTCKTVQAAAAQMYRYDFYGLQLPVPVQIEDYCFEVYADLTTLLQEQDYVLWETETALTSPGGSGRQESCYTAFEYLAADRTVRGEIGNDTTRDVASGIYSGGWSVTLQTAYRTVTFSVENTDPEASSLMIFPPDPMSDILPERISREQLVLFIWGLESLRADPKEDPLEGLKMVPDRSWTDEEGNRHTSYAYDYEELLSGILTSEKAHEALSPQEEILSKIAYIGDRSLCQMSPEMAKAYAEKLVETASGPDPDRKSGGRNRLPDSQESEDAADAAGSWRAILVDAGGDGQPLLMMTEYLSAQKPSAEENGVISDQEPLAEEKGDISAQNPSAEENGVISDQNPSAEENGVVSDQELSAEENEAISCQEASASDRKECAEVHLFLFDTGQVKEISLSGEYSAYFSEEVPTYRVSVSSTPYLTVQYTGTLNDGSGRSVIQENYYQVSSGNLRISHTGLVIGTSGAAEQEAYFDGKKVPSLEKARITAGIGPENSRIFLFEAGENGLKAITGTEYDELVEYLYVYAGESRAQVP